MGRWEGIAKICGEQKFTMAIGKDNRWSELSNTIQDIHLLKMQQLDVGNTTSWRIHMAPI